jgi:N-acetylglucosaminyl-diphospho-decaprenol L-rhamnosyltransferase
MIPGTLVDVVLVSYDSADVLRAAVEPLCADERVRVIVADNNPGDGSADSVRDLPVTIVDPGGNVGFGRGCNAGAAAGWSPYLLFLNPDARLTPGDLDVLVDRLRREPTLGVVAPRIEEGGSRANSLRHDLRPLSAWGRVLPLQRLTRARWADDLIRDPEAYERAWSPSWMSGACLLVRRAAFTEIGGFHDGYWMYCEDADLCRALRVTGWRTGFEPGAPRASLLTAHAESRVRYAARWDGPRGEWSVRAALALHHLVRAALSRGRAVRSGHAAAARAAIAA